MYKIGLVGEAPNDTDSIQLLLEKRYSDFGISFFSMLDRIRGSQLDDQKTKRLLRLEYELESPDYVVFIRDLDSLKTDRAQLAKRKEYFTEFRTVVDRKAIFLLHIWEIEAIILADIEVFNKEYKCEEGIIENPSLIKEPKEFLKLISKGKYKETDNSKLFEKIRFEKALKCDYFDDFIFKFQDVISTLQ